jgi:hypothetical protein
MESPLPLLCFRIHGRTEKGINDHGHAAKRRGNHREHQFPISEQSFQ